MRLGSAAFGGVGLGIDLMPQNVEDIKNRGMQAIVGDATNLQLATESVRFSQAFHFLEHLPDRSAGEKVIDNMIRVAKDFVLAIGPDFSGAQYLNDLEYMKYFASFKGHTWQHTALELSKILGKYKQYEWKLIQFDRIFDSYNSAIVPFREYKKGSDRYDPANHGPKEWVRFGPKLYTYVAFALVKRNSISPEQVLCTAMKPYVAAGNAMLDRSVPHVYHGRFGKRVFSLDRIIGSYHSQSDRLVKWAAASSKKMLNDVLKKVTPP